MTTSSLMRWATVTFRCSTVESGLTTKTNGPSCPVCTASFGTTVALLSVVMFRLTRANSPGHNRRSVLSNFAFSLIVSVDASTVLSMNASVPLAAWAPSFCGVASTVRGFAPPCS